MTRSYVRVSVPVFRAEVMRRGWFTKSELAAALGCSPGTIDNRIRDLRHALEYQGGGMWRFIKPEGGGAVREHRPPPEQIAPRRLYAVPTPGTSRKADRVPNTDARRLVNQARRAGATVRKVKHGWLVVYHGRPVTTIAGTATDWRSSLNARADMRRAGMKV